LVSTEKGNSDHLDPISCLNIERYRLIDFVTLGKSLKPRVVAETSRQWNT
jgi:hypothetical protein